MIIILKFKIFLNNKIKYNKDSCKVICNIHVPHQLFPDKPSFLFSQLCGPTLFSSQDQFVLPNYSVVSGST